MKIYLLQTEDSVPYKATWVNTVSVTFNKDIAQKFEDLGLGIFEEIELDQLITKDGLALPRIRGYKKKLSEINQYLKNNSHFFPMKMLEPK